MKMLFDLFPVILFFVAYQLAGIYIATATAIVASIVQVGWAWFRRGKVDKMLWVSLAVIVVFGGATLIFQDKTFIQWKPTVLYWIFGVVLAIAALGFKKNLVRSMMEHQVSLPNEIWNRLLASWIGFFVFMGVLNLYVAYSYSEQAWVNFKLFGGMGLMLAFVLLQAVMLAKHVQDKNESA
jgi:intracellular septation protein